MCLKIIIITIIPIIHAKQKYKQNIPILNDNFKFPAKIE